jgi:hypothetical protein
MAPGPFSTPRRRLYLAAAIILVAGWAAAACVFVTSTGTVDADAVAYRIVGGNSYPITLGESKRDLQKLERLGGKATVWVVGLDAWLGSLWHGQRLSYTLALLSTAVAGLCAYIAGLMAEGRPEMIQDSRKGT